MWDTGKRSRDRSHEERTNGKRHRSEEDSKESEVPSAEKPPGVILEVLHCTFTCPPPLA